MAVISAEQARKILEAGGFRSLPNAQVADIGLQLDQIASNVLNRAESRQKDERGRWYKGMGRESRKMLFNDLAGVWLDLPGVGIAGVTFTHYGESGAGYSGRFYQFARAYCAEVARYMKPDGPVWWKGLRADLQDIANGGAHVRDGLRLSVVPKIKKLVKAQH